MAFVYHLVAEDFRGTQLLPLRTLAAEHPDVHHRELAKWAGRESVLDVTVPHLDVTWGETVNLAGLDPTLLVAARRRLGLPVSHLLQRRVVRIPVERIVAPAVQYDSRSHWLNSRPGGGVPTTPPPADFTAFDPATFEESTEVPALHLDYLVEQRDAGQPALGFVFVRHVLVAGPVDIAGLDRLELG